MRPAAYVNCRFDIRQRFVHRDYRMPVSLNLLLITKFFGKSLSEANPSIFKEMMYIYINISCRCESYVKKAVFSKKGEHVGEKRDRVVDFAFAGSVDDQL